MNKTTIFNKTITNKQNYINNVTPKEMKTHDGKSFTRNRSLTLKRMMSILLQGITKALQLQLDDYYEGIGCKGETVSKQAFSKARTNLDPNIVKESFLITTRLLSSCDDLDFYKGKYRLCAIDGSATALDNAEPLREHFGCSGRKATATTALTSLCYDPLNNTILDGGIYPYATDERTAARAHIKAVGELPLLKGIENLYIFDRGYPSKEFMSELLNSDIKFLFRVRKKFNLDIDDVAKKEKVSFSYNGKDYQVRVFKINLPSGETETLVTNVGGKYLKHKEAGELYFKRWCIETKFNSLKNKLELENMSGRRPITVYQDFWAKLDIANTIAALEFSTNEAIEAQTSDNNNIYRQTTNENRLISHFSKRYADLLCEPDKNKRRALFDELVRDITKYPVEVKPDRAFIRKTPRKMKFHDRLKRVLR